MILNNIARNFMVANVLPFVETAMRVTAFTGIIVYGMYSATRMYDLYVGMEMSVAASQAEQYKLETAGSDDTTLAGCATDMECYLAEQAALMAVAAERGKGSYGGGGRTMAKR